MELLRGESEPKLFAHKFVVTSEGESKMGATEDVLNELFPSEKIEVIGKKFGSDVDEQPEGKDMTMRGALNRFLATENSLKVDGKHPVNRQEAIVSFESGIELGIDGEYYDFCYVIVQRPDGKVSVKKTVLTKFPRAAVEEAARRGFDLTTVGEVMKEMKLIENEKDPHKKLTGIPRRKLLKNALIEAIIDLAR